MSLICGTITRTHRSLIQAFRRKSIMSTNLPIKPELLLCVCTLMPGAAGARAQKQRLGRDVMRLPANFSSAGQIAKIIQAQPPGKALELDVVKPPAVQAVARLLPVGTRVKGSD